MSSDESDIEKYDETGQNAVAKWPSQLELKMCSVQLRKLNLNLNFKEDSNSSDDELPALPFILAASRSTRKSRKSSKDLTEEFENLAKDITADNLCENNIEEKLRRMEVIQDSFEVEEEESLSSPPPPFKEEMKEFKIFCVNEYFQYFNCMDITLLQCGYRSSFNHTHYEEELLSFSRVELEHILSSFLYSYNVHSISDCKSFATYLLKNLSVHPDVGCIKACSRILQLLLEKHPDASKLTFSSAEIFMLLFNYGTDLDSFNILLEKSHFLKSLGEPSLKKKSSSKVPQSWIINLTFLFDAIICLFDICKFPTEDLGWLTVYFLYMTLDSYLIKENLIPNLNTLINESLDLIPRSEWPKTVNKIASTFIRMEFSSLKEKWSKVLQIAQSLPASSVRSLELRKHISFLALKHLGKGESDMKGSKDNITGLSEASNVCSISELESLLKKFLTHQMDSELIGFGVKFLDICISHLKATDEEFEKLCNILKQAESALTEQAYEAKAHFVKMHARMKIHLGKNPFYKVAPEKNITIKKELCVETENVSCSFDFVKVKKEPGLEPTTPCMVESNEEKLIRFSDFNCDNDDGQLDFDSIGKQISSHDVLNSVEAEKIIVTDQTISTDSINSNLNVSQNFEKFNTVVSDVKIGNLSKNICLTGDDMGDLPVIAGTYSASTHVENNDVVSSNSVLSNPSLLKSDISATIKVEPIETEMPKLSLPTEIEMPKLSPMLSVDNDFSDSVLASDKTPTSSKMDTTVSVKSGKSDKEINDKLADVLSSDLSCGFTTDNLTDSGKSSKPLDPVTINIDQVSGASLLAKSLQSSNNLVKESCHSVQSDDRTDTGQSSKLLDPVIINVDQVSDVTLLAKSLQSSNNLLEESHSIQTDNRPDAVFFTAITSVGNQTESGNGSKQLDPVIINIGQALKNEVSPANNLSDHSEPIGNRNLDTRFSSAKGNQPDVFAQLCESLALPEGTEISPIKTDVIQTDSTRQRKSSLPHLPGVASGEISMTVIEDDVIIVEEVVSPTKPKKSKKHPVSKSNDQPDLQILFSKPVARSPKSKKSSKLYQDKSSSSKSSDEDVTVLTEIHSNSGEKDSSTSSKKVTGGDNLPSTSQASESNNISDDDGVVFICQVDSPSKSKMPNSQNVEIASKDPENVVNSPTKKSNDSKSGTFSSSNRCLSRDGVIKFTPSETNILPAENDQVVSLDSDVQLQTTVQSDLEVIDSEVAEVMNEGILKNFIDLAKDAGTSDFQPEQSSISFNQNALNTEGDLKNIGAPKEGYNNISMVEEDPVKTFFVEEGILVSEFNEDKNTNLNKSSARNSYFQNKDSEKGKPSETLFVKDVSDVNRHDLEKVDKTDVKNNETQNKDSEENNVFSKMSDETLYVENRVLVSEVNVDKYENTHTINVKKENLTNNYSEKLDEKPSETSFVEDVLLEAEVNENKSENNNEVDAENCDIENKDSKYISLSNEKLETSFVEGEMLMSGADRNKSENICKNGDKERWDFELNKKPSETYFVEAGMLVSAIEEDNLEKITEEDAKNGDKGNKGSETNENPVKTCFVEGGMHVAEVSKDEPEKITKVDVKNSNMQFEDPEKNSSWGKPQTFFLEEEMLVQEINKDKPENINKTNNVQNEDSSNSLNEKTAETFLEEDGMLVSEADKDNKPLEIKLDVKNSDMENEDSEKISMLSENSCKTLFVEGGILVSENIKNKPEEIDVKKENLQKKEFEIVSTLYEKPTQIIHVEEGICVPEENKLDKFGNTDAKNNTWNIDAEENSLLCKKFDKTELESGQPLSDISEDTPEKINAKNIVADKEDFVKIRMKLDEIISKALDKDMHSSEVDQNKFENSNEINSQSSAKKEFEPCSNVIKTLSPKAKKSFKRKFVHEVFENECPRGEKLLKDSDRKSGESVKMSVLKENLGENLSMEEKDKSGMIYTIDIEKDFNVVKKFLKRKSVDEDIENKRSKTEGSGGIEKDVSCILNNLLESSGEMNSECVDKSLYNTASCDKSPLSPLVNNYIQEAYSNVTYSIRNDRLQNTPIKCNENQTSTFQYRSSSNLLNLNALIDSKKGKSSKPSVKTKNLSTGNGVKSAADDDLQLLKIAKRCKTKSPLKFSPGKSPKGLKSKNSPSKYFDYKQKRSNYCAFNKIKKTDLLTHTGLNLKNILREKIQPAALPSQFHQNSLQTESCVLSDSDSDVMELYVDPKRYRDKECLITYESEDIIVIDSD